MKSRYIIGMLACMSLVLGLTGCKGEKDFKIIEGELPIKTTTLYMVGDATPNGWSIDNPTPLTATEEDPLIFQWEGPLYTGELKLCLTTGSWDAPFIRPLVAGTEINKTNIVAAKFAMHAGDPDEKWRIAEAGKYQLTFNLREWTMSTSYLGELDKPTIEPIVTEVLYIVGDATPNGWNIDAPTALNRESQYIFSYEGVLLQGEMKACLETGNWDVAFVRPSSADCVINQEGVAADDFVFTTAPDNKWKVEQAGTYRVVFDLENWKISAEYLGEAPAGDKTPIEAEGVYMVGDATPNGWSIDAPTALTRLSKYIYRYEGELVQGEMKMCIATGSWDVPFIRPATAGCKISADGVESEEFVFTTGPDDKWQVVTAADYRITVDLEHWTIKAEVMGNVPAVPALETTVLYIVGDATPNGWSIDAPTALTRVSQYVFRYEGTLTTGELKACTSTGSWDVPFVRPTVAGCKINASGVANPAMVYTTGPDDKWVVEQAGKYRLTFDVQQWTLTAEKLPD